MTQEFNLSELDELYREIILDHYRHPRNSQRLEEPDISEEAMNPFCGDEVTIQVKLKGAHQVASVGLQGIGCSISRASASMLTELIKGKSLQEVGKLIHLFTSMMEGKKELGQEELERLGDLVALQGVRKFPVRIKCALLGWATLEEGIEKHQAKKAQ